MCCWQPTTKGPSPRKSHHQSDWLFPVATKDGDTCADSVPFVVTRQPLAYATQAPHFNTPCVNATFPSTMPSTRSGPVSRAASALLLLSAAFFASTSAQGLKTMKEQGCYSRSATLKDQGENIYQSSGKCQEICVADNQSPVMAMTEGSNCWCGDMLPPDSDKVDSSNCDTPCDGYDKETCMSPQSLPSCARVQY